MSFNELEILEQQLRAHKIVAPRLSHARDTLAAEAAVRHFVYGEPFQVTSWARSSTAQQVKIAYEQLTKSKR
jgi:hypothetical protein